MKTFFIILVLFSAAHIIAIVFNIEWLRRISKVLLIPSLLAVFIAGRGAIFTEAGVGTEKGDLFVIFALIFGWIGDALLIKKNKRAFFKLGITSFLIGHLCYIVCFLVLLGFSPYDMGLADIQTLLLFSPVLIIGGIFVYGLIKPFKEMKKIIIVYMAIIMLMALFGFEVFFFKPGIPGALIFFGSMLFLISDTLLAYYAFRKIKVFPAAMIMVSYILAQTEIVLGILWL
jgi:uncharacterized membrane protein YhhN